MGKRGPKPQPTVLKIARGNPGHRALNSDEPVFATPSADAIEAPSNLPAAGVAEWNAQIGGLLEKGVLTTPDLSQFRQYCWMFAEVDSLEQKLAKARRWDDQQVKLSNHLLKLHGRLTQLAAHFGLTPSSRSGIVAVRPITKDAAATKRERFFGKTAS